MVKSCNGCGFWLQNKRLTKERETGTQGAVGSPRTAQIIWKSALQRFRETLEAGSSGLLHYRLVAVK